MKDPNVIYIKNVMPKSHLFVMDKVSQEIYCDGIIDNGSSTELLMVDKSETKYLVIRLLSLDYEFYESEYHLTQDTPNPLVVMTNQSRDYNYY